MRIKLNPTGTHIQKGFLKVRLDFYPETNEETYALHYVDVLDKKGNPTGLKKLNPCLCHFITVAETISRADMENFLDSILQPSDLKTLDDVLVLPNAIHYINPFMRNKTRQSDQKVKTTDLAGLFGSVNERLSGLNLVRPTGIIGTPIQHESIDIGMAATDRPNYLAPARTAVNVGNPANASGSVTSVQVFFEISNESACEFATFEHVGSNNLTTRDSETIGEVVYGSTQTFSGLDMTCVAGDYIGVKWAGTGELSATNGAGLGGMWYATGDYIPCTSQAFTLFDGTWELSVYGTGDEAGGEQELAAAAVAVASSVQAAAVAGSGTAPLAASPVAVVTSVQMASIANVGGVQTLTAASVAITASVIASAIAGSGIVVLTAAFIAVASSVKNSSINGSGTAALVSSPLAVITSVVGASLAGSGVVTLSASPVAMASSVQNAVVAIIGILNLTAAPVSVTTSVMAAILFNILRPSIAVEITMLARDFDVSFPGRGFDIDFRTEISRWR